MVVPIFIVGILYDKNWLLINLLAKAGKKMEYENLCLLCIRAFHCPRNFLKIRMRIPISFISCGSSFNRNIMYGGNGFIRKDAVR